MKGATPHTETETALSDASTTRRRRLQTTLRNYWVFVSANPGKHEGGSRIGVEGPVGHRLGELRCDPMQSVTGVHRFDFRGNHSPDREGAGSELEGQ